VPPVSADVRDTRLASQLSFHDVALADQRMARYPVFRDATRGHEEFAIRVRDDHHLNRHVKRLRMSVPADLKLQLEKVPVQK
jgi:hypothetical protein